MGVSVRVVRLIGSIAVWLFIECIVSRAIAQDGSVLPDAGVGGPSFDGGVGGPSTDGEVGGPPGDGEVGGPPADAGVAAPPVTDAGASSDPGAGTPSLPDPSVPERSGAPDDVAPGAHASGAERAEAPHAHPHVHAHTHPHDEGHLHEALGADPSETGVELEVEATADATAAPPPPASTGDFLLEPGLLRDVPRLSAESWLTLAPSVFLVNHSGTYHASTILLRGFDAGEGQDLEVLVDGVPINDPTNAHGHGYADTHFVIPELVSRVRVLEGPFSPEQSDFAVAGSAAYELGTRERGIRIEAGYGSFESRRLLLVFAPHGASDGTFVGVDLRDSAGFGTNRSSASASAMGRLELEVARDLSFHVLAAGHFAQFDSAGVVRADDVAAMRLPCGPSADAQLFCTYDPFQGGASARALVSTGLAWHRPHERLEVTLYGGYRSLRIREDFTGFLLDARGDGLDEQYSVGLVGMRGRFRSEAEIFGRTQRFELGWVVGHRSGDSTQWRLRRSDSAPHTAIFDDELHLTHIGGHVATELSFAEWLDARVALRADAYGFSTVERARPAIDRMGERVPAFASDALGVAIQPRATVRVLFLPELAWQTSVGVGTRSSDAIALSEGEFAPFAEVVATETGLSLVLDTSGVDLDARVSAYHTHVDRDLVFDATRGRNVELGASSRIGALGYLRAQVEQWLDVSASFAWNEAFLLAPGAGWSEWVSSTRMPYVPRWVGRLDAAVSYPIVVDGDTITVGGALGVGWLGERPLPLSETGDQVVLVDTSARVRWRLVEVGVAITNLFDARWQSSVFNYASSWDPAAPRSLVPAEHFAAGAPFSIQGRLAIFFDETQPLASLEPVPGAAPGGGRAPPTARPTTSAPSSDSPEVSP